MSAGKEGGRHSGERSYWNEMAGDFDGEIFDVCGSDRAGLVFGHIRKLASRSRTALDVGCGIGRTLPQLSKLFGQVCGADISGRCLARAARLRLPNVTLLRADITRPNCRLPKSDVVVCINTILSPSVADSGRSLDALRRALTPGGAAVVVVPALESVLYARARIIEHCWRRKKKPSLLLDQYCKLGREQGSGQPVAVIDGIRTKHFLREELLAAFEQRRFRNVRIEKVEYDWASEMADPPWPDRPPYPWDWCVTATI